MHHQFMNIELVWQFGWVFGEQNELGIIRVNYRDKNGNVFRFIFFGLFSSFWRNGDDQSFELNLIDLPRLAPNSGDACMRREFFDGDQRWNIPATVFAE